MMHDVDDATLMQALRHADPRRESTLDDRARHRLEQSWREAMAAPEGRSALRWATVAPGRTLQPVAAAIMAVIILASGVLLSNITAQRGTGQPGAGGVEGSFRAVRHVGAVPVDTFLLAGGRALIPPSSESTMPGDAEREWRGLGGPASMRIDSQVLFDGDQVYLRISADGGPFRWYRYRGAQAMWPPGLAETPQPVFEERTRGFERVDDEDAQAQGLTRYTADVDAADLDFLGWFTPANHPSGPTVTRVDILADSDGRVRRLEEHARTDPGHVSVIEFDRFDAVEPIDPPYQDDADAPVAEDVAGMMMYAYGDPAFADDLRERVTVALERDPDIATFEIYERSAADKRNEGPDLEGELFVVALRFTDDIVADLDAQREKLDRLSRLSAGALPANAEEVLRTGDVFPDPQGFAAIYGPGLIFWKTLDG